MAPKKESIKNISISTIEVPPEDNGAGIGKFYYPAEGEWILAKESAEKEEARPSLPPLPVLDGMPNPPPNRVRPNRQRHGKGLYVDGGYEYNGEWKNDKMHGNGCFKYANGASYDGQWDNNLYMGTGTYMWPNGAKYVGGWRENKMHGDGTYIDKNGNKWSGQFFNGIGPGLVMEIT